jgi:hypothetical protein
MAGFIDGLSVSLSVHPSTRKLYIVTYMSLLTLGCIRLSLNSSHCFSPASASMELALQLWATLPCLTATLFFFFLFETGSHYVNPSWPGTHCMVQTGLELREICLHLHPECWATKPRQWQQLLSSIFMVASWQDVSKQPESQQISFIRSKW